jgi:hypothetical protein
MVYLAKDYYTASGSVKLYHSWTDKVTKFDTSSFYNWEQDNLPLYDLDERTYYLWEQLGHPTSSLPGVALVVSAGGDPSEYEYNRNNFETVSAAIAALPQVLNYPVIIEICNKGALGNLDLKNIKCGPNGSLEIVNKVFAKAEPDFNSVNLNIGALSVTAFGGNYGLLSSVSATLAAQTYSLSFSPRQHFYDTKSEFLNLKIFDTTSLTSINNELNGFVSVNQEALNTRATYFIRSTSPNGTTSSIINIVPFETTSDATGAHLVSSYDISGRDTETGDPFVPDLYSENTTLTRLVGLFYGNNFRKVTVTNCDGPIYLRNFFIDGSGYQTGNEIGLEVTNSRNIILENCVSVRNTVAGFYINNSKVVVTRGIGAYRNYGYVSNTRLTEPTTESNINRDLRDSAAGLYAINSEIQFSSTSAFERAVFASDPVFSAVSSFGSINYGSNYVLNFERNANGIILNNSKLFGGITGSSSVTLTCQFNNICGLKLINSYLDWDGRVKTRQNNIGILANNSHLTLDKYNIRENTIVGLHLTNSELLYNKKLNGAVGSTEEQFKFDFNGKHISLHNSNYKYVRSKYIPNLYGVHRIVNSNSRSILVDDSSNLQLVHGYIRSRLDLDQTRIKFGDPVAIENGSKAVFKGSDSCATTIIGSPFTAYHRNSCGVYVNNNSTVDFQGPTAIARHNINCLAENNSTINFVPHKNETDNELQVDEFNLSNAGNHTRVELHSDRSCLVANNNSNINMFDLGAYTVTWDRTAAGTAAIASGTDYNTLLNTEEAYVSGGFLQFYPNSIDTTGGGTPSESLVTSLNFTLTSIAGFPTAYYLFNRTQASNEFSGITLGGVCLRAVNNSVVNVRNVNFPAGFWNPSGVFFNSTAALNLGNLCCKLMIWNIADNSQLHASYLSVSSIFPQDAGYHGPYGTWLASLQENGGLSGSVVSAVFPYSTDPYTGSAAVLDLFGSGPSSFSNFTSSFNNQGPFRLFFSTDPLVNHLSLASASPYNNLSGVYYDYGWIAQAFSQGYNPPGYLSATLETSSLHKNVLRHIGTLDPRISPSIAYYTSGIFRSTDVTHTYLASNQIEGTSWNLHNGMTHAPMMTRVFLDESAANTFANSKHCSTGKSSAPRTVSIYYPYNDSFGDSNYQNKTVGNGITTMNSFDLTRDN